MSINRAIYRDQATGVVEGNEPTYNGDDASWDTAIEVSSTNILLRVQGDATNNTIWTLKGIVKETA